MWTDGFLLFWLLTMAMGQSFNYQGCFNSQSMVSLGLTSMGTYIYQSVAYCQQQCSGQEVAALLNGGECFCGGSSVVDQLSSLTTDEGQCSVPCEGYPYQNCGGRSYMNVYVGSSITVSQGSSKQSQTSQVTKNSASNIGSDSTILITTSSSNTLVLTSSTTTLQPSTSSDQTTAQESSTSSSSSSSSKTKHSSVTLTPYVSYYYTTNVITTAIVTDSNNQERTVYVTATSVLATSIAISNGTNSHNYNNDGSNKSTIGKSTALSGGAIAGVVIGSIAGTIIVLVILVLFYWKKRAVKEVDIEETKQHQPYSFGDVDANPIPVPERSVSANWRKPSRNNTSLSSDSDSSDNGIPTSSSSHNLNDNSIHSTSLDSGINLIARPNFPSTLFEDDPEIYEQNQRFSSISIPDMMENRHLHIVNPDNEKLEEHCDGNFDDSASSQ